MYEFDSRVRYSETDAQGRMTWLALMDYFQDCSVFHSEAVNLGVEVWTDAWGTDGICKFRMGTDGYKEGDSGQSDKRNLGCIRIGPTASHAVQRAENYAAGKI